MKADDFVAIDVHVHLEHEAKPTEADAAAQQYFGANVAAHGARPSPTTTARARWRAWSLPSTST